MHQALYKPDNIYDQMKKIHYKLLETNAFFYLRREGRNGDDLEVFTLFLSNDTSLIPMFTSRDSTRNFRAFAESR